MNLEAEGSDETQEVKPPPKMSDIVQKIKPMLKENANLNNNIPMTSNVGLNQTNPIQIQQPAANYHNQPSEDPGLPPKHSQPNMFKLQKNRSTQLVA